MAGLADKKYTFKVAKDANKIEIAKAVEELFGVSVAKVNTMNVPGRFKRQGMNAGLQAGLEEGHRDLEGRLQGY